jgi:hypothetical protein
MTTPPDDRADGVFYLIVNATGPDYTDGGVFVNRSGSLTGKGILCIMIENQKGVNFKILNKSMPTA